MRQVIFEVYDNNTFFNMCKKSAIKVRKYNEDMNYYICTFNEYIILKENTQYCVSLPMTY